MLIAAGILGTIGFLFMITIPDWVYLKKTSELFKHPHVIATIIFMAASALCAFGAAA